MAQAMIIDLGALWLSDRLLAASGDDLSRLAVERISSDIESGATDLDGAVKTLSGGRRPQPGEFGLELAGSAVLAVLLPVAQRFFERYVQKLTDGAADHVASWTLERLKELFRQDVQADPERIAEEFEIALKEYGHSAGINPQTAERFLALVRDSKKLSAATSS